MKVKPLEYRVIVMPDRVSDTLGSGIIHKAEETKINDRREEIYGKIVAVSDVSFTDWDGEKPKVGDRIMFAKYAGRFYKEGEEEYRIMRDGDVIGIIKESK